MWAFLFVVAVLCVVGWAAGKAASNNADECSDWHCPHGYDNFACSTSCPFYNNCLSNGEDAFIAKKGETGSYFFRENTIPTDHNEDGDWRTVFMDDERYDEREEDELYDDDRENHGW